MDAQEFRNLQEAYLEVYNQLDEAEGSYGHTPKAHAAFNALRVNREKTPASKFRNSGGKTAAVDSALHHTGRSGGYHPDPGKKSPRPDDYTIRKGMTQSDRDTARQQRDYDDQGLDMYDGPASKGPKGSLPRTSKKRQRQRMTGVSAESYDLYDIILLHLLDEGYAETPEAAEAIMVNMSEDWRDDIIESDAAMAVVARATKLSRQRKGQTPERRKIYKDLATQAGERANPSPSGRDLNNRTGMTPDFRRIRRGQSDWNIEHNKPGGITKNPKKLRKQKALGEFGESYWRDDIIEGSYEDRIAANNKKYNRNRQRAAQRAAERNAARAKGQTGVVPGVGYVSSRRENETWTDSGGVERHTSGARMPKS